MRYFEWIVIAVLALITAITLIFMPPATAGESLSMPSVLGTPTATTSPTSTPIPTATVTPTPFSFDTRPSQSRYIYVNQGTQPMYVFEQGELGRRR